MILIKLFLLHQACSSFQLVTTTRRRSWRLSSSSSDTAVVSDKVGKLWQSIPMGPPDAILGIAQAFRSCQDSRKVNVCVGAYRDDSGKPWVLPSVRQAEHQMLADPNENKEYLPIEGDVQFVECALRFAYGEDAPLQTIAGVQTLSGTGACRVGGDFLAKFLPGRPIYIPHP
jgi:aspartate aminotransferase